MMSMMQQTNEAEANNSMSMSMQMQPATDEVNNSMQSTSGGMTSMTMQPSSTCSSTSSDNSAYRSIERIYKLPTCQAHLKRRGESQTRFRARMQAEKVKAEQEEWERWKPHTLDLRFLDRNTPENRARIITHERPDSSSVPDWVSPSAKVYSFTDLPGLHVIANALDVNAQAWWSWHALRTYSNYPHTNVTNLEHLKQQQEQAAAAAYVDGTSTTPAAPRKDIWKEACTSGDFSTLSKLRWASLGYHYNWTNREYTAAERSAFPDELSHLSSELAAVAGFTTIKPEAAIVNYYPSSGMMGAHIDDAELTKLQPIVSVSLGCSAIFLIGGRTKATIPTGFLVRSGDCVVMGGESRVCFHGVPRIIDQSFMMQPGVDDSMTMSAAKFEEEEKTNHSEADSSAPPVNEWTPELAYQALKFHPSSSSTSSADSSPTPIFPSCVADIPTRSDLLDAFRFLRHARVNMNVRQVEDATFQYSKGMTSGVCRKMGLEEQIQMDQQK